MTEQLAVRYAQKQDKMGFFINKTTVLPESGRMAHPMETLGGQPTYPAAPQGCQEVQNGKTAA